MTEYHSVRAFAREEPRIELIESMLTSLLALVDLECEGQPVRVDGFRLRDLEAWRTVHESSLQENLGSLSTVCNCKCAFCYEDGNPENLFEKQPRFVSMAEAKTRQRYLHDGLGLFRESKGFFEPLANPHFIELLELMRETEPDQIIDVTTNGALLTPKTVSRLSELGPVYVNVSLISADETSRRLVMGDSRAGSAIRAIEELRAHEIPFMGTLVPWPEQGIDDVRETIEFLDAHDARIIRVALPGLTQHHPRYEPDLLRNWQPQVMECVSALRRRLGTPIFISPFAHVSAALDPIIEGVIRSSPAAAAGIRVGDRLQAIDGTEVVSRAHAISLLKHAARRGVVDIDVARGQVTTHATLLDQEAQEDAYPYQPRGYRPMNFAGINFGLCLPGAFHLQYLKQIYAAIEASDARRTLVAVSRYYRDLVAELLTGLPLPADREVELLVPENAFFGGNVDIGDLWVLDDIERAVRSHMKTHERPDLLVLPSSFLSRWGRDLRGTAYTELEASLGLDIALVRCERIVL